MLSAHAKVSKGHILVVKKYNRNSFSRKLIISYDTPFWKKLKVYDRILFGEEGGGGGGGGGGGNLENLLDFYNIS